MVLILANGRLRLITKSRIKFLGAGGLLKKIWKKKNGKLKKKKSRKKKNYAKKADTAWFYRNS